VTRRKVYANGGEKELLFFDTPEVLMSVHPPLTIQFNRLMFLIRFEYWVITCSNRKWDKRFLGCLTTLFQLTPWIRTIQKIIFTQLAKKVSAFHWN